MSNTSRRHRRVHEEGDGEHQHGQVLVSEAFIARLAACLEKVATSRGIGITGATATEAGHLLAELR